MEMSGGGAGSQREGRALTLAAPLRSAGVSLTALLQRARREIVAIDRDGKIRHAQEGGEIRIERYASAAAEPRAKVIHPNARGGLRGGGEAVACGALAAYASAAAARLY